MVEIRLLPINRLRGGGGLPGRALRLDNMAKLGRVWPNVGRRWACHGSFVEPGCEAPCQGGILGQVAQVHRLAKVSGEVEEAPRLAVAGGDAAEDRAADVVRTGLDDCSREAERDGLGCALRPGDREVVAWGAQ